MQTRLLAIVLKQEGIISLFRVCIIRYSRNCFHGKTCQMPHCGYWTHKKDLKSTGLDIKLWEGCVNAVTKFCVHVNERKYK